MNWKQAGIILTALVAFITLASFAGPLLTSDAPPWAAVTRVDDVKSLIVRGNILGRWSAKCEAERAGNIALAQTIGEQISTLIDDYARLKGPQFPLGECP